MKHILLKSVMVAMIGLLTPVYAQVQDDSDEPDRTDNKSLLEDAAREMKVAADLLSKKTTQKPTQKAQDNAISKLDSLIAELEKQRSQMGSGVNPNATRPANESTVREGPGGMGDLHSTPMKADRWGELPAHERDRILQSLTEGFPPHYQAVLEAYYKRLAVEKKLDPSEIDEPPVPKPPAKAGANQGSSDQTIKPATSPKVNAAVPASKKMTIPAKKTGK